MRNFLISYFIFTLRIYIYLANCETNLGRYFIFISIKLYLTLYDSPFTKFYDIYDNYIRG